MRTYGAIGQDLRAQDLARCGGSRWARHQQEGPLPAGRDRDAEVPPIHVILLDLGWCVKFSSSRRRFGHSSAATPARLTFFDTERPTLLRRRKPVLHGCASPRLPRSSSCAHTVRERSPEDTALVRVWPGKASALAAMTFSTPPRGIKTLWCSHPLPTDIFRHDLIRSCLHSERIAVLTTSKELLAHLPRQIIGSVEIAAGPGLHPTRSGTTPRLLVRILPARKASVHDRVVTSARLTFFDTERPTLPRRGKARASGCTTPHPHHHIVVISWSGHHDRHSSTAWGP